MGGVKIALIVGSATPPGRTHAIATALESALRSVRHDARVETIDLARVAFEACDGRPLAAYDESVRQAVDIVASARCVVFVTPVYRATYPGVLKNFLDIVPLEALRDTVAGLAVIGGSAHHYLGVDLALRAVLTWFGALSAPTGVYFTGADFDERKQPLEAAKRELKALAETVVALAEREGPSFGPAPLAARRP